MARITVLVASVAVVVIVILVVVVVVVVILLLAMLDRRVNLRFQFFDFRRQVAIHFYTGVQMSWFVVQKCVSCF